MAGLLTWVPALYADLALNPAPLRPQSAPPPETEERSAVLPPLPPGAEHYYADLVAYKNADVRAALQLLEDDTTRPWVLAPLPPIAEGLYSDLDASKNADTRAWLQLILDEDTRRELLPAPAPAFDDWDWSLWFGAPPAKQSNEAEWSTFTPPAVPPPLNLGWDEFEWNRSFGDIGWRVASASDDAGAILVIAPFVPDDWDAAKSWGSQGFSGLLVMDEFVNAPAGGVAFGPPPKGRSVRFGFSISAFR